MADVKWIKLTTNMFDDEKIKLIEKMPEGMSVLLIWIKLLTLAGKCNATGYIYLSENIPYSDEMLSTIFNMPLSTVRLALKTFNQFSMIDIEENNLIRIVNWDKHQNIEGLDKIREQTRKRVANHRKKQNLLPASNVTCNVTVTDSNATEEEVDKEVEEDIDKEVVVEQDTTTNSTTTLTKENLKTIMDSWNELKLHQLKAINQNTNRHKMLKARLSEYSLEELVQAIESIAKSKFLKGQNKQNWVITFDWFIKPNNFLKVLEGNYIDKGTSETRLPNDQNQSSNKHKTKFHLSKSRGDKYTDKELEELILNNQKARRGTN